MDTKLKGLNKRRQEILLAAGWMVTLFLLTYALIFRHYGDIEYYWSYKGKKIFVISGWVMGAAALITGVAVIVLTVRYLRKYPPSVSLSRCKKDDINTELTAAAFVISGYIWADSWLFGYPNEVRVWHRFVINTAQNAVISAMLVILCLSVFLGSFLILFRQFFLGILPETAVILKEINHYRHRTPLEKRIQDKGRLAFVFQGIICAGMLGCIWRIFISGDSELILLIMAGLIILSFIIYAKSFFSGRMNRHMGYLTEKIRLMELGGEPDETHRLNADSMLYETSCQLDHIGEAMQKSAEKQVQAERMKIDLITNVSHDLKTPLTSMVGYTDLLKKEELGAEARDYVEVIAVKQEQLKNMIQDLFELSKATSGTEQLKLETLDMRRLLEQTMGDMEDAITASGHVIRTTFGGEPLPFVGDNGKMYRVVQNLLENALKYALEDTRIYIQAEKKEDQIVMQMKNIASYEMDFAPEEITERFVRGDKSRSTTGHGLGLAIASSFVQNMKGNLQIEIDGDLFKVTVRFPCEEQSIR